MIAFLMLATPCAGVLVAIAFVALGATVVRRAHPMSGYLLVTAGAVELSMTCCLSAIGVMQVSSTAPPPAAYLIAAVAHCFELITVGCLLASVLVGLVNAGRRRQPTPVEIGVAD